MHVQTHGLDCFVLSFPESPLLDKDMAKHSIHHCTPKVTTIPACIHAGVHIQSIDRIELDRVRVGCAYHAARGIMGS
jgi:hypothetical protein